MRNWLSLMLLLSGFFGAPVHLRAADAPAPARVYIIPIREDIMPPLVYLVRPGGTGIQDLPTTVEAKMNSAVRALVRRIAEKNGYDIEVVEAMIDKNKELIKDGKTLNKKGEILTLTETEAAAEYGNPPKPLISSGTFDSLDALLKKLGYADASRKTIAPTGAEK